ALTRSAFLLRRVGHFHVGVDRCDDSYKLTLFEEEVALNPALLYRLASEQVRLPELPKIDSLKPTDYLADVLTTVQSRGWWVHGDVYLGLFSFLKITMYEDLSTHADQVLKHPLVRALAGDARGLSIPEGLPVHASLDAAV